jgi:hypothetical protein
MATAPPASDLPHHFPEGTNQQQREERGGHNRGSEPSVTWRDETPKETHDRAKEKKQKQPENVHIASTSRNFVTGITVSAVCFETKVITALSHVWSCPRSSLHAFGSNGMCTHPVCVGADAFVRSATLSEAKGSVPAAEMDQDAVV